MSVIKYLEQLYKSNKNTKSTQMVVIIKNTYPNILSKVKSQAEDIQWGMEIYQTGDRIVKWLVARL